MADEEQPEESNSQKAEQEEEPAQEEVEVIPQDEPPKEENIESNIKKEMGDGGDEDEDEIFEGSTHNFAVYYGQDADHNLNKCIVAVFVIIVQWVLYMVCAADVLENYAGDEFKIPVMVRYGKPCMDTDADTAQLLCPPEVPDLGYVALAAILLSLFLMHDIMAGIKAWIVVPGTYAKIAAFTLIAESIFAAIIGILFAVSAQGGYDAIANCIGVLFIHDVDEKAFEAFSLIEPEKIQKKCCSGKMEKYGGSATIFIMSFLVMVVALIFGGVLRAIQVAQIKDEYGDDYWDSLYDFSYGSYYDWDSTS
eukprot:60937_1